MLLCFFLSRGYSASFRCIAEYILKECIRSKPNVFGSKRVYSVEVGVYSVKCELLNTLPPKKTSSAEYTLGYSASEGIRSTQRMYSAKACKLQCRNIEITECIRPKNTCLPNTLCHLRQIHSFRKYWEETPPGA